LRNSVSPSGVQSYEHSPRASISERFTALDAGRPTAQVEHHPPRRNEMTVMSRDQERVLGRLVAVAGGPLLLQDALDELRDRAVSPTLDALLQTILRLRHERQLGVPELPEVEESAAR